MEIDDGRHLPERPTMDAHGHPARPPPWFLHSSFFILHPMKNEEWRMKNEEWRMKNEESNSSLLIRWRIQRRSWSHFWQSLTKPMEIDDRRHRPQWPTMDAHGHPARPSAWFLHSSFFILHSSFFIRWRMKNEEWRMKNEEWRNEEGGNVRDIGFLVPQKHWKSIS